MTDTPLHPLIEDWLADLDRRGKSERTVTSYRRALTLFARWSEQSYGDPFDPAAIIPRDVEDWKSYQQTVKKAAPTTINQRQAALSRFFKWCAARGHVRADPTVEIGGLRLEPRQPKSLPKKELRRFRRAVSKGGNLRDIALVELLLGTGLRISEALALQRDDLIMNDRSGKVIVRRGKGGVSRQGPLTAPLRRELRNYLDSEPDIGNNDPVWVGERGELKSPSGVYRMLKKYARRAGIDESLVSPHILRHTFATRYLAANPGDLRGLAAILGHSNLDTVMIYTAPTAADLTRRMEQAEVSSLDIEQGP